MNNTNVTATDAGVDRFVFVHGPTAKTRSGVDAVIGEPADRLQSI